MLEKNVFFAVGEIESNMSRAFFLSAFEKPVTDVVISSPGGDIGLTYGMHDVIKFQGASTHVVGLAQSSAAVLLQAGKRRTMTNSSLLMFHSPATDEDGHVDDKVWRLYTQLVEMVSQRSGINIAEAHDLFDNMFITANRALELGLIDEIAEDAKEMRWFLHGRDYRDENKNEFTKPFVN
jgi:ATP-dependent protease ClpP protease subunit